VTSLQIYSYTFMECIQTAKVIPIFPEWLFKDRAVQQDGVELEWAQRNMHISNCWAEHITNGTMESREILVRIPGSRIFRPYIDYYHVNPLIFLGKSWKPID
jgi:hypothetical protein